jgi:hypothetical protein
MAVSYKPDLIAFQGCFKGNERRILMSFIVKTYLRNNLEAVPIPFSILFLPLELLFKKAVWTFNLMLRLAILLL